MFPRLCTVKNDFSFYRIVPSIRIIMSSESKTSSKSALSVFSERVYKLWPWLKSVQSKVSAKDLDNYYEMTYAFGEESWKERLQDGTDEDESQRGIFVFLVCLEFGFDGSSPSRPGLWEFWRQLHKQVICPCFKSGKGEEVMPRYISWPAKTFGLDEGLLRVIFHKVYDTSKSTAEEDWVGEYFYAWMLADREHFLVQVKEKYDSKAKVASKQEDENSEKKTKKKPKIPVPKKRSVPKPKSRKQSAELEDSE